MCGIVGAVSHRNIVPVLIEGLRRLEYRGYDSCGVAVVRDGILERARTVSRVAELDAQTQSSGLAGHIGIAHTRWATHGKPDTVNAHPHFSDETIALVHNGIIENYEPLRDELRAVGYGFESQTDTEVVAHLIHQAYTYPSSATRGDLFGAVRAVTKRLHGAYAIAVVAKDQPDVVVGARAGSPLVVALGEDESFLASDALAVAGTANRIIYLEEGDVVESRAVARGSRRARPRGRARARVVEAHAAAVELGPYRHFMQKEIFEQPRALGDTLEGIAAITPELFGETPRRCSRDRQRADPGLRHQLLLGLHGQVLARIDREDPDPGGSGQRIPLPRHRAEPARAGGGDLAVGRDGRHDGRAAPCPLAGPHARWPSATWRPAPWCARPNCAS
jgi:glucosamine--fructose-6-phosphate aminotransferase (isomerizing)